MLTAYLDTWNTPSRQLWLLRSFTVRFLQNWTSTKSAFSLQWARIAPLACEQLPTFKLSDRSSLNHTMGLISHSQSHMDIPSNRCPRSCLLRHTHWRTLLLRHPNLRHVFIVHDYKPTNLSPFLSSSWQSRISIWYHQPEGQPVHWRCGPVIFVHYFGKRHQPCLRWGAWDIHGFNHNMGVSVFVTTLASSQFPDRLAMAY